LQDAASEYLSEGTSWDQYQAVRLPGPDNQSGEPSVMDDYDHTATAPLHFQRNGLKLDPFHFLHGYLKMLKKGHGAYLMFSSLMRDALFVIDKSNLEHESQKLYTILINSRSSHCYQNHDAADKESRWRLLSPVSKVLKNIKRHVPAPEIVTPRIQRAVELCADIKDAKRGEIFFAKATWEYYVNAMKHAKQGCLSDMPDIPYYYYLKVCGKMCVRGTSQLEGFHMYLRRIVPRFHSSPRLVTCLLALFVYHWNIDRAVERGFIDEAFGGWYAHDIILQIKKVQSGAFDNYPNFNDFADTGETFYPSCTGENQVTRGAFR
jgi:hypothetical protein